MAKIKPIGNITAGGIAGFTIASHGGGCCGIRNLYSFPIPSYAYGMKDMSLEDKKETLNLALTKAIDKYSDLSCCSDCDREAEDRRKNWHCAVEVVLIPEQVSYWGEALEAVGFKEVFSFYNSNSGNRCHVFYVETNKNIPEDAFDECDYECESY